MMSMYSMLAMCNEMNMYDEYVPHMVSILRNVYMLVILINLYYTPKLVDSYFHLGGHG